MTLLVLDVVCPKCGTRPNLRVLPTLVELVQHVEPDHLLGTWSCQSPRCESTTQITARMVQRAAAGLTQDGTAA